MIIATANSKGGVGKTTLAVHIAGWLHEHSRQVALVDCDEQCQSSEWIGGAFPDIPTYRISTADEVYEALPRIDKEVECVIVDAPGALGELTRSILMCCDAALLPCKAGKLEASALAWTVRTLRQAQALREGPPGGVLVLNMTRSSFVLAREMQEVMQQTELPVCRTVLPNRQAYARAAQEETVVWKAGASARQAAVEMNALMAELFPEIHEEAPDRILNSIRPVRQSRKVTEVSDPSPTARNEETQLTRSHGRA